MKKTFWFVTNSRNEIQHICFCGKKNFHFDVSGKNPITESSEKRIKNLLSSGNVSCDVYFLEKTNGIEFSCRYNPVSF